MKRKLFKSLLAVALICTGSNAWADTTSLYERGTTNAWANTDLTDWTAAYCTPTIDGGLSVTSKNAGWTCTKSITVSENSIVTLVATLKTGGAPGRNGSYDYVKVGGVTVGFKEQDKVAFVDVDGTSTNLSLTYNRSTAYTINVVINTATGAVSYTVGSASGTSNSRTAITNVVYGHSRAGSEGYDINPILQKIEVSEEKQELETAEYTINYQDAGVIVKTTTGTTAIGSSVPIESSIWKDDVKYIKNAGEPDNLTVNGEVTLGVAVSEAPKYSYTVNAKIGSKVVIVLATGEVYAGENAPAFYYPQYLKDGDILYSTANGQGGADYYQYTNYIPATNNAVLDIIYENPIDYVVYFSEGEDISGASVGSNAARASKGRMGFTEGVYKDVTTLPAGKYQIFLRGVNGNKDARAFSFKVGETEVYSGSIVNGTNVLLNSDEFTVSAAGILSVSCEGSSSSGLDWFYVKATGYPVSVSSVGWATAYTPYALDFSGVTGLTAYTATCDGTTVKLTPVTSVPANTGVVLEGEEGSYTIPFTATPASEQGDLEGNATEATAFDAVSGQTLYVLALNDNNDVQFRPVTSGEIAAGKAYLPLATSSHVKALNVAFGTATGINAVESARQDGMMFNLAGQRVSMPARGLYIKNGKKVVVK